MTSSWLKWLFLLAVLCFEHLDCEIYQDRPKIKTSDGDLILEPALDKNIYLRPNGPKSSIYVGNVNLLNSQSTPEGITYQPYNSDNVDSNIKGILARLERLESKNLELPVGLLLNISLLYRKVNNIHRKVLHLESVINIRSKDGCESDPCEHGGTCLNLVGGYHCLCPSNWEGRDCDVDVNECRNFAGTDLGCQNGAACINRPGTYECLCKSGWFGLHCTRKAKDCSGGDSEMCGHGTCVQVTTGEGIQCLCHQGWTTNGTGVSCQTDINECESYQGPRCSINPKVDCINLPGSFRCGQCPRGYEGDGYSCTDIDECMTIPNGGCSPLVTCHNTIGSRICGPCPPDYQGDGVTCTWRGSCNIAHGGCHPSAQCIENPSPTGKTLQCICPEGMVGDGVGISGCYVSTNSNSNNTEACENNPCGTHGQCHSLRTGYTCICYKGYGGAHCESQTTVCAVNPCQNGGICRSDDSTIGGFRCECTAQYSGPLCQVRTKSCGGVLDHEEGSIVYPLTNTTYTHNSQCAWVIHTSPDKVINVTFSKFNLEGNDCAYDFLQIHDGRKSSSQLIGRFCGNNFPKGGNIVSSHNNLYFWFHSDSTVAKDGFALHWTSIKPVCGGQIDATTHGHISSPGSPGPYPPNRDCYWHLTTTLGKRINLHFFDLDIESHTNCSFDYLAIYDGEHLTDPLINKYCNSTQPAPVHSAGSDILIHFHSDAYSSGRGFQIAYAPIEGVPGCGGYYTADKGEIVSPTYNGAYLSNLLCEYKIKTSLDTKIKITFKSFKLERSFRCKYDYLKIYDGASSDARVVGKFCGNTYPNTYTSTTNSLYLIFRTDRSMASDGFRITYEAICEQTIIGDSGIIKSPGYPFSYPANKVCVYVIATVPGKAIRLTFQDFDIEDSKYYDCRYDNVEVRDGHDTNSSLLGRYCGGAAHTPPVQTSTLNYMYIRFQSDMSLSGTGFYANYTTIDTECGGVYRETTGLINHPSGDDSIYKNYQTCKWILIAPEGMHIKLTWNRFDIEDMPSCASDYLKLIEIDDDNEYQVLGTFCGAHSPPALTTSTNRLMLQFESDGSIRSSGFSLSYSFLDEKTHCSGTFIKTHGYIYSPGWPKSYEPNRDCTWIITVPVGQQIKLNISQFNLERPIRNKCNLGDYLEIRNGGNENSPLIGQFCGEFKSKIILSLSNAIHLHFHSDYYLTGTGFKIEWDGTITGCGGTLTSPSGSISSPNYPNNYDENAECFYRIVTSAGSKLRITFTELDLERTTNCRDDYIEIYDGRSTNANSLGKYCFMSSELGNIETSTNYAYIKFRSDIYQSGKGFLLNYQTICSNNVTGKYGVIESPGFPSNYPSNLNCLWNIQVPIGNRINVTFIQFDIYKARYLFRPNWPRRQSILLSSNRAVAVESCNVDYLQVKELSDPNYSDRMCGSSLPQSISTKGNALQIKFITSTSISRPGFRLEWISYGCGGHIQKQMGTVSIDKSKTTEREMECEWLIETRPGKSLSITFTEIYMTDTHNCTTDAIEIYNGQNAKAPLLIKVCHNDHVSVESDSNYMLVRFAKRSTLRDVHFSLQFRSKTAKCGGSINSRSGLIYSKNYPKNYDNNLDCVWYIIVPEYHRIELNFLDLDLYSLSTFDDDYQCDDSIQIYDNNNFRLSSNYTYRICPNSNVTQITSKYNNIIVQFKTDESGTAKGFKANFSVTCGAVIKADREGFISSNNFVNHLNKSCIWTILAPTTDQKIYLMLTLLSLPKDNNVITNRNCPSTFLRVRDGDEERAPLIGEYCGRKVPPMIVSRGSALTIEFGSYTGQLAGMFSAHYSPVSNACGGTLFSEEGTIASPNYPGPYPGNTDCEWIIKTSAGYTAYIQFERFNLPFSESCNGDYVEIRENNGAGRLLGVYCDNDIPTNNTIASQIYIKFHSNSKSTGLGFLLHYGLQRENNIQGESGEITSPLYPARYSGSGEYVWRVMTSGLDTISISIDKLQIYSPNEMNYNKLTIYDGYDITAPVLVELNGILSDTKLIMSSSSVVYITFQTDESNTGSSFHMSWSKTSRNQNLEPHNLINCGGNQTEIIYPGREVELTSPNYPNNYKENLNCEWVYKSEKGRHLAITFPDFEIEETTACFADSVSIYSSDTPGNWKPVKENMCTFESANNVTHTSTYMKVTFKTDSSMTRKGFRARVVSQCGGLLTDLSGQISPNWWDSKPSVIYSKSKCEWTVKVRPGRTIQLSFTQFNITNKNDECSTYVMLKNGDSAEAPTLASGKYCGYEHEKRTDVITSGNSLYVSYTRGFHVFETFTINYEEKNDECGSTSTLSPGHDFEIISSPNYPSVPVPYSECEWVFYAPPGEILRIEFIDRFDLDYVGDCETEVVEIRDGASRSSPPLGRFCSEKPGTVKTTSNAMYIKYFTQLTEPRNGFKANVTIDTCGGTIIADSGEVTSPGYPHMHPLPYGTVCKWHIIGPPRHIFLIKPQDIHLPQSETACSNRVTIEEAMPVNNSITILKKLCLEDEYDLSAVETSRNNFTISLYFGKPDSWDQFSENRGFRITFNSSRPMCGGVITSPEGYLTSPSYPQETTLRYCQWLIILPNKSRKVLLEIMDLNLSKHRIAIYNDLTFHSIIQIIPGDDYIPGTTRFESTSNKLAIYVWLNRTATSHRFKAKFTSDEPSLCGGELSGLNQEIISPDLNRSYTCEWHYNNQVQTTDNDAASTNLTYNSIFLNINMNSSMTRTRCRFFDPKVVFRTFTPKFRVKYSRDICGNTEASYVIPAPVMDVMTTKSNHNSLYFHINLKSQPCGGEIQVEENPINILNVPDFYNDTLDCAWVLSTPVNSRIELKMEGSFTLECEEEFLKVSANFREEAQDIGNYCKTKLLETPLTTHFSYMYVHYHTNVKNKMNLKLMARTVTDQCGGYLSSYQHTFASPNYPKQYSSNQECSWEIRAQEGYRVSLRFVDRFFIEESTNCTHDVVIIFDWNNDAYTEMARVCGRQIPPAYNSTHNRMKVVLRTNADINQDGFRATWDPFCGGNYTAVDKEQILYSPGYPYSYPSRMTCSYEISAPNNNNVYVKFLDFELEGLMPICNNDNLTINAQSDYHYLDQIYCGSDTPPIVGQFNKVSLRFKSDSYIQRRGFKISYSIYRCGGKVNDSTVLSSTLVDTYNENLNCTWFIEAPSNKIVVLKFLYIDLEGTSECYTDYIAAYEGLTMDSNKRLALLCGHLNSTTILRSKGNTMLLQFVTDSSISFTGFKVQIYFSYSESAQCGGKINLSTSSSHILKTPLMGRLVYENYLDCYWSITSPPDTVIKISFTSFHISPCENVTNQTAIGYSNCDCDLVEIRDGLNPNSLVIGTYCGHSLPPQLTSSGNLLSVRLATDGELGSHGFEATLTAHPTLCGRSIIPVSYTAQRLKSPGFDTGSIARGIHCTYGLDAQQDQYSLIRITIMSLDLRPAITEGADINHCNNDKLLIYNQPPAPNITLGKDYVVNHQPSDFFSHMYFYESSLRYPDRFEFCGLKGPTDLYVYGSSSINIITSAESDSKNYKGVEIEVAFAGFCGRNYSEPYGRIQATYPSIAETPTSDDCYTLITAPENYTISAYFINSYPDYWDEECYLDIFDGNSTSANRIVKVYKDYDNKPVFSVGRYMLLHNHVHNNNHVGFDLNYIITNKGPGCGGKLESEYGRITSPLYPNTYRRKSTCEWEIKTPINTHLLLRFSVFDLGITCDQNYLQLVNSKNVVVRTFCSEMPADYTSDDNYVKVVFVTTQNNGGTGWSADFIGVLA